MSFEVLEQLESKIQTAVDTITLLQMEVEELKEDKVKLEAEANELRSQREDLEQKAQQAQQAQQEHAQWQERIRALLGKMDEVE
ncbi:cell division protein ZapB [Vibrio parahaemolyticus]|uniref:cell division protein ZapB n=1 Tax=Vibrio parahaemolyticus TaxID=670 RepID=UPI00084ABC94|nr:cell division protein ZapB [Vibrio parahaemolyticus]MDG2809420.1 cell division protein ZapB [Vibrio parahaemolyticus]ODZ41267.1 septal ring assembly protein ZapB [Vibrio parahaemolyticus]HBN6293765.1 cell division protein ZapB [Vibrio parahaemolyticus]